LEKPDKNLYDLRVHQFAVELRHWGNSCITDRDAKGGLDELLGTGGSWGVSLSWAKCCLSNCFDSLPAVQRSKDDQDYAGVQLAFLPFVQLLV
jgi:hypothetical protein